MATVEFLGPIEIKPMEVNVKNMKELSLFLKQVPEIQKWLDNSAVAVNDTVVSTLDIDINEHDVISILPPVCGG